MRVLFINTDRERAPVPVPPADLCRVASAVEDAGHEVRLVDLCFARHPRRSIMYAIGDLDPQVIAVHIRRVDNDNAARPRFLLDWIVRDVITFCREIGHARIALMGPAVTLLPAETLRYTHCDLAVAGEAEGTFVRLLEYLGRGVQPDSLPGVARGFPDGTIRINPPDYVADLDRLPHADAHHWLNLTRYEQHGGALGLKTKRGSAFARLAHPDTVLEGPQLRRRSPRAFVGELADLVASHRPACVDLADCHFNYPLDHTIALCAAVAEAGLDLPLTVSGFNPAFVTQALVDALQRARVTGIRIQADSAADAVLAMGRRGFGVHQLRHTAALLQASPIARCWVFTLGLPGETLETVRETLDFCRTALAPHDLALFSLGARIYPRTRLARLAVRHRLITPGQDLLRPVFYMAPHIDYEALCELIERETAAHPNWILSMNGHTVSVPPLVARALAALDPDRPFWCRLPLYNRLSSMVGLRRRHPRRCACAVEALTHRPAAADHG